MPFSQTSELHALGLLGSSTWGGIPSCLIDYHASPDHCLCHPNFIYRNGYQLSVSRISIKNTGWFWNGLVHVLESLGTFLGSVSVQLRRYVHAFLSSGRTLLDVSSLEHLPLT
jgi:hypothetical protein